MSENNIFNFNLTINTETFTDAKTLKKVNNAVADIQNILLPLASQKLLKIQKEIKEYNSEEYSNEYTILTNEMETSFFVSAYVLYLAGLENKDFSFDELVHGCLACDRDFILQCNLNYYNVLKHNSIKIIMGDKKITKEDFVKPGYYFDKKSTDLGIAKDVKEFFFSEKTTVKKETTEKKSKLIFDIFENISEETKENLVYSYANSFYSEHFDPNISAAYCLKKGVTLAENIQYYLDKDCWESLKRLLKKYPVDVFKNIIMYIETNEESRDKNLSDFCIEVMDIQPKDKIESLSENLNFLWKSFLKNDKAFYNSDNNNLKNLIRFMFVPSVTNVKEKKDIREFNKVFLDLRQPFTTEKNKYYPNYVHSVDLYEESERDETCAIPYFKIDPKWGHLFQSSEGADAKNISRWNECLSKIFLLDETSKLYCLIPNDLLLDKCFSNVRKYLIEKRLVERIYRLPNANLVVFSHCNKNITFVKAFNKTFELIADGDVKKEVSLKDVCSTDYSLSPDRYLPQEDETIEIGEVFEIIRGTSCSSSELKEMLSNETTPYKYLTYSGIHNGFIDNELPSLRKIEKKYEKYCAKEGDLIISKIASPLKVSIVTNLSKEEKILVGGNLYILRSAIINPYFLKAFLDSQKGLHQIEMHTSGESVQNLSIQALKKVKFPVIPLKNQENFSVLYQKKLLEIQKRQAELSSLKKDLLHIWDLGW